MTYDVILHQENNAYIARVKEWPEVSVKERRRDEAIHHVKTRLRDYLTKQVDVVQIEVSLSSPPSHHPWSDKFGWFQDDPTFDDLQAEIAAYRKEIDQSMAWEPE